jgi:hypothetical protein
MNAGVPLYNPRVADPEQLEKLLTGRTALLEELLDNLRGQAGGSTRQHWLLRGQRGMGKTHLTGVIHHRVRTDPVLREAYLPLWLGEADVYEVYSAATLLVKIAERLAEAPRDDALLEKVRGLEGSGDEEVFFEAMIELLSEEAKRRRRTLLVLMENLDVLLGSFASKERAAQTRQLRSVLLHHPEFLFVSTTPTRHLRELSDPKEPLYGHMKERDLAPLTEEEVGELFQKLVDLTGRKELGGPLQGVEGPLRLRIVHHLTGGLPRSVIMAFMVLQGEEGLASLVEGLRKFLDAQTAYFEARLDRLSPRERAIVTTLALAPLLQANLTLKEISQKSRLPERTMSTLMQRLEDDGHVRPVAGVEGKGTRYELSEGLFRIWYQYRRGQPVLEPLVGFIAVWFPVDEIATWVQRHRHHLQDAPLARRHTLELVQLQLDAALRLVTSDEGRMTLESLWESARREAVPAQRTQDVSEALRRQAESLLNEESPTLGVQKFFEFWKNRCGSQERLLADVLNFILNSARMGMAEDWARKLELFQALVSQFGHVADRATQSFLNRARSGEILVLRRLGRSGEALEKVDSFLRYLEGFGESAFTPMALWLKVVLLRELGRVEESEKYLVDLLQTPKTGVPSAETLLARQIWSEPLIQAEIEAASPESAPKLLELYASRFSDVTEPFVRQCVARARYEIVTHAFVAKGPDEAIPLLDGWLKDYRADADEVIRLIGAFLSQDRAGISALYEKDFKRARHELESAVQRTVVETGKFKQLLLEGVLAAIPWALAALGPEQLLTWCEALERSGLDEIAQEKLALQKKVMELVAAEQHAPARGAARQRQKDLLRIPRDVRKLLEDNVREVRRLKRELGAKW